MFYSKKLKIKNKVTNIIFQAKLTDFDSKPVSFGPIPRWFKEWKPVTGSLIRVLRSNSYRPAQSYLPIKSKSIWFQGFKNGCGSILKYLLLRFFYISGSN